MEDYQYVELFPIVKGTSRELIFNAFESRNTGIPFTQLEGSKIHFIVRRNEDSPADIITKKTSNESGGGDDQVLVDAEHDGFSVFILPADTNINKNTYYFHILITTSDSKVYKVKGYLPII